ncbi:MAG: hypothetical protein QNJ46_28080 [Leptolyngbyaceae cyanobacterium MO_188.B28]|nr:hypothetical protein [Leptolyngbyaceae cyanobacterium MO_188.B28]
MSLYRDPQQFPNTYLIPHRQKVGVCLHCGERFQPIKISGRLACPNQQPPLFAEAEI